MPRGLSALATNAWPIQAFFWLEWGCCGPNPPLVSLGAVEGPAVFKPSLQLLLRPQKTGVITFNYRVIHPPGHAPPFILSLREPEFVPPYGNSHRAQSQDPLSI